MFSPYFLKVIHLIWMFFLAYMLYALALALLPYLWPKRISDEDQKKLNKRMENPSKGDRVLLVETPKDALWRRIQLLRTAEESLDISYHCVKTGESVDWFIAEILAAADRGVKIRFLMDGKVNGLERRRTPLRYALFIHPNIEFRVFNPLCFLQPWKWNTLLHDKYILVDQKLLILGGRNLGDAMFGFGQYKGLMTYDRDVVVYNTHDSMEESVLRGVKDYMDEIWTHKDTHPVFSSLSEKKRSIGKAKAEELQNLAEKYGKEYPEYCVLYSDEEWMEHTTPTEGIYLVHNPITTLRKAPHLGYVLSELAKQSLENVLIETPYTTGYRPTFRQFALLGNRHISCHMVTNSAYSTPNIPAFSNYLFHRKKIVQTGVLVKEYQKKDSIHAKSFVFDHRISVVGSYNLDNRSIYIDTETVLVIDSPVFSKELEDAIDRFGDESVLVGKNNRYEENAPVTPMPVSPLKKAVLDVAGVFFTLIGFLV